MKWVYTIYGLIKRFGALFLMKSKTGLLIYINWYACINNLRRLETYSMYEHEFEIYREY